MTKDKEHGGLDIKRMHNMNLAFMAKLGGKLINEKDMLWAQVILKKYTREGADISKFVKK